MPDERLHFGEFCFVPASGRLTRHDAVIPLEHQPALVLAALLAARGRLITRRELAATIWRDGTHVKFDDGLNYCIRQIRCALGDDARAPRFIETVPRRGYRFIAPDQTAAVRQRFRWRRGVIAAAAAAVVAVTLLAESRPNNHHQIAVAVLRAVHDLIY